MSQLRLIASQSLNVWSKTKKKSRLKSNGSSSDSLPSSLAQKADKLAKLKPRAAAVVEKLVDDLLRDIAKGERA